MIGSLDGVLVEEDGLVEKRGSLRKSGLQEKNEGDTDLRSMRISERRRSEEGTNIRGKIK
jgi:hypothetical protein